MNGGAKMIRRALLTLVFAVAATCGSNANGPSSGTGGSGGTRRHGWRNARRYGWWW